MQYRSDDEVEVTEVKYKGEAVDNAYDKWTFVNNGDGTLTWDAEGSDIFYQGTTDKELPVNMKITYTLDGKEIGRQDVCASEDVERIGFFGIWWRMLGKLLLK